MPRSEMNINNENEPKYNKINDNNMKKINLILTAMLAIAFCFTACSSSDNEPNVPNVPEIASGTTGSLTWKLTEDGVLTISGNGEMPNYANTDYVPWYSHRNSVEKVVITSGVTSIGNYAFLGCKNLASIIIPNSVTSIGIWAFNSCSGLTSIILPNSVKSIESGAFWDCINLTNITIPNGVTNIGVDAFLNCSKLKNINIPNSLTNIGDWAFSGCSGLVSIEVSTDNQNYASENGVLFNKAKTILILYPESKQGSYTIPNGVVSIGKEAFIKCDNLTSVTIPNSLTSFGSITFINCSSLTSIEVSTGNPNYSSENGVLFNKAKDILIKYPLGKQGSNYTIPNSVTSIAYRAFCYHNGLTSITIPNDVVNIGDYVFSGCAGLINIIIPSNVTNIGHGAFTDCNGLTQIRVEATTPPTIYSTSFYNVNRSIPVYVPAASLAAYQSAEIWKTFTNITGF